jgi:hypothetical protein
MTDFLASGTSVLDILTVSDGCDGVEKKRTDEARLPDRSEADGDGDSSGELKIQCR